jgi:hypothetical protein
MPASHICTVQELLVFKLLTYAEGIVMIYDGVAPVLSETDPLAISATVVLGNALKTLLSMTLFDGHINLTAPGAPAPAPTEPAAELITPPPPPPYVPPTDTAVVIVVLPLPPALPPLVAPLPPVGATLAVATLPAAPLDPIPNTPTPPPAPPVAVTVPYPADPPPPPAPFAPAVDTPARALLELMPQELPPLPPLAMPKLIP